MKTVIVKKQYLNYAIGDEIQVRDQDAALLIPRGVVSLKGAKLEEQIEPDVEPEPVEKPKRKPKK